MSAENLFVYVASINAALFLSIAILVLAQVTNAPFWKKTHRHLRKQGVLYAFITTLLASLASLYLSEIAGITPCLLCWWQRAFMYPAALFLGLLYVKKQEWFITITSTASAIFLIAALRLAEKQVGAYTLASTTEFAWYALIAALPLALHTLLKQTKYYSHKRYALGLVSIGGLIALYHYGVQRVAFISQTIACTLDASCSTMYLGYWGFYSIPLMALVSFIAATYFVYQTK
ncbi:MAG: disulfide bond formation protein B [Candidatus Woesearchaeota archaeon]